MPVSFFACINECIYEIKWFLACNKPHTTIDSDVWFTLLKTAACLKEPCMSSLLWYLLVLCKESHAVLQKIFQYNVYKQVYWRRYDSSYRLSKPKMHLKKKPYKIWRKQFSIWRMAFLHPAMWHDHDIDFARWLHPAVWHVALESWQWIHRLAAPCNVIRGCRMTCHWIRPSVCHIGILHLVSILTISQQSTCHSALVCENLSKLDHPWEKKMMSCRFSRWRISAILDFRRNKWRRNMRHSDTAGKLVLESGPALRAAFSAVQSDCLAWRHSSSVAM